MPSNKRQFAIRRARELLLMDPLFLDTETTGLGPQDEIVEIAILDVDGNALYDSLVQPTRSIPLDATWIHGITDAMVAGAPAWPQVWSEIEELLSTRHVGIYNAEFDLRLLRQSHHHHGLAWDGLRNPFCIMKLYADFYPYSGGRYQKLEIAGRQCGIPLPNSHRARADTTLALAVFKRIAASVT